MIMANLEKKMSVSDLGKCITLTLIVSGLAKFKIRTKLALLLIRMAKKIAPFNIKSWSVDEYDPGRRA